MIVIAVVAVLVVEWVERSITLVVLIYNYMIIIMIYIINIITIFYVLSRI